MTVVTWLSKMPCISSGQARYSSILDESVVHWTTLDHPSSYNQSPKPLSLTCAHILIFSLTSICPWTIYKVLTHRIRTSFIVPYGFWIAWENIQSRVAEWGKNPDREEIFNCWELPGPQEPYFHPTPREQMPLQYTFFCNENVYFPTMLPFLVNYWEKAYLLASQISFHVYILNYPIPKVLDCITSGLWNPPSHLESNPFLLSSVSFQIRDFICFTCSHETLMHPVCQFYLTSSHHLPMLIATISVTQQKSFPSSPHSIPVCHWFCHHRKSDSAFPIHIPAMWYFPHI